MHTVYSNEGLPLFTATEALNNLHDCLAGAVFPCLGVLQLEF